MIASRLAWPRAPRPHACAPVSRCTTVPSRSPPQRLRMCQSVCTRLCKQRSSRVHPSPRAAPAAPAARHPAAAADALGRVLGGAGGWAARWHGTGGAHTAGGKGRLNFLYSMASDEDIEDACGTMVSEVCPP